MLKTKRISLTEMFEQEPCKRATIWTDDARCYVINEDACGNYDYLPNSFIVARDIAGSNLPSIIFLFLNENQYIGVFIYSSCQSKAMGMSVWCNINMPETGIQPLIDKINELTKRS